MLGQQTLIFILLTLFAITSGHEASLGKYPYHASIRYKGEHQCSGSIIDQRHVLTAYACIIGTSITDLTVEVGTNSLNTSGVQYKIQNTFRPDTSYHDIVLLYTDENIVFNHKISPIEITPYDYKRNGYPMIFTAFKRPPSGKPFTDRLQEYKYEIFDGFGCMGKNGVDNNRFMCFIKSDGERVCNADFGGAIVADNYLVGVKLPGDSCVGNKPEQHLRIYYYLQGIPHNSHLYPNANSSPINLVKTSVGKNYEATVEAYPYHVSIQYKDEHMCSGSIIDDRHVLTSKKCVSSGSIENFSVIAGTNSLETKGYPYEIQDIITLDNSLDDIALLRTQNEILFNDKVKPIKLTDYNHNQIGYPVILTAFKRLPTEEPFTSKLQAFNYRIYEGPECKDKYIGDDDRYICVAKLDKQRVCNMDYGGAIVAHEQIIGIKLYGDVCVDDEPEVHLRVHHYLRWIKNNRI